MRWEKLENIIDIKKGAKPNFTDKPDKKSVRVLQIDDLRNDLKLKYTDDFSGVFAEEKDILLAWDGANAGTIGYGKKGFIGSTIARLRKKNNEEISTQYLGGFLQSKFELLRAKSTGATIPHIDGQMLRSLKIPLPSVADQIKIATILSKTEKLIAQRKQSIALLDEFLKSTFLEMFGDPMRNERGWEKIPLKKFGDIITGNTPPRNDLDNFSINFIEWIKTDNIQNENLFVSKANEYLSEEGLKKSRFVEKGALLVACIAGSIDSVGRANLTDRKVSFNQQINAIQPNQDINSFYLYHLFKNARGYIQNHASKGMKKILTKGEFEKIMMIKPPLALQTQFSQIVEKTEALKTQYKASLQELENLFGQIFVCF